jgi:hypothetical protein
MLPHKGSLTRAERRTPPAEVRSWAPVGWFILVAFAAAAAWALCLPSMPTDALPVPKPAHVFHLDWFLVSTTLAFLVSKAARSSWVAALATVPLVSAQMLAIADEGARRLQIAGLVSAETDMLYLLASLQVLLFVTVGVVGARRSLADRRVARLNRRLAALDPANQPTR